MNRRSFFAMVLAPLAARLLPRPRPVGTLCARIRLEWDFSRDFNHRWVSRTPELSDNLFAGDDLSKLLGCKSITGQAPIAENVTFATGVIVTPVD